jgi:hypothetical protein
MVAAVPASADDVAVLMTPFGVKTSVNELSLSVIASTGPRQAPSNATTQPAGSAFGEPPVSSTDVLALSVLHQACTWPVRVK